jgi:hypothetical protein
LHCATRSTRDVLLLVDMAVPREILDYAEKQGKGRRNNYVSRRGLPLPHPAKRTYLEAIIGKNSFVAQYAIDKFHKQLLTGELIGAWADEVLELNSILLSHEKELMGLPAHAATRTLKEVWNAYYYKKVNPTKKPSSENFPLILPIDSIKIEPSTETSCKFLWITVTGTKFPIAVSRQLRKKVIAGTEDIRELVIWKRKVSPRVRALLAKHYAALGDAVQRATTGGVILAARFHVLNTKFVPRGRAERAARRNHPLPHTPLYPPYQTSTGVGPGSSAPVGVQPAKDLKPTASPAPTTTVPSAKTHMTRKERKERRLALKLSKGTGRNKKTLEWEENTPQVPTQEEIATSGWTITPEGTIAGPVFSSALEEAEHLKKFGFYAGFAAPCPVTPEWVQAAQKEIERRKKVCELAREQAKEAFYKKQVDEADRFLLAAQVKDALAKEAVRATYSCLTLKNKAATVEFIEDYADIDDLVSDERWRRGGPQLMSRYTDCNAFPSRNSELPPADEDVARDMEKTRIERRKAELEDFRKRQQAQLRKHSTKR